MKKPIQPPQTVVCAWCKKVISKGSKQISHGICAECARKEHKEVDQWIRKNQGR